MAPKLYTFDLSPPARAVLLCEKALGIQLEYVNVNFLDEQQLQPEFVKINPQHTVPTLVDDDGTVVWDSHAIMAYLVGKYGQEDSLYPKNLAQRALVDQRMYFESEKVFPVLRYVVQSLFKKQADSVSKEWKEHIVTAYDFLNTFLEGNLWVAGNQVTIADFSLLATVTSLMHLEPIDNKYTNIHAWLKRAQELPYYDANIKGVEHFKTFIGSMLKK